MLFVHQVDVVCADLLEQGAGLGLVVERVRRLDDDDKGVVGTALELLAVEDRVIVPRQAIEQELAEESAKGRKQYRALVENRKRKDDAPVGLAAHLQGVIKPVHIPSKRR